MKYTRNTFFKLSKPFKWYGPVHEFIIPDGDNQTNAQITSGIVEGLGVNVQMDGGSWQGDIGTKYLDHAHKLETYLVTNRDPRWVFYTAQSWHDSAVTKNKTENNNRLKRSLEYYKERANSNSGYHEERYYSQLRVGIIKKIIGEYPWSEVQMELLKAYNMDPLRGESIKFIVEHYQQMQDWNMAYIFSHMAYNEFHGKSPYPNRLLFVDAMTYNWRILELHITSLFQTKRIKEAQVKCDEMIRIVNKNPEWFSEQDLARINKNVKTILSIQTQPNTQQDTKKPIQA
jgi:hypothetical protein